MATARNPLPLDVLGRRIGRHHFVYLRAVAEGVPADDAAKRYLGVEHAAAAGQAHRLVVERVRALARRRSDRRWRLIGLEIHDPVASAVRADPSHDEWAAPERLEGW